MRLAEHQGSRSRLGTTPSKASGIFRRSRVLGSSSSVSSLLLTSRFVFPLVSGMANSKGVVPRFKGPGLLGPQTGERGLSGIARPGAWILLTASRIAAISFA